MTARVPLATKPAPRTPSRREIWLSWALLSLLPVIAAVIYVNGQRFDPNVFALDAGALGTRTVAARQPAPAASSDPEMPAARPRESATSLLSERLAPFDWPADGPAERFTAGTLYQKIDGRADEYLRAGFISLESASYARGAQFIDVFAYDMGSEAHALARFSSERPPGATAVPLGRDGYCVASSCFFVDGRYYVQVIGSEPGTDIERTVLQAARAVAGAIERRRS